MRCTTLALVAALAGACSDPAPPRPRKKRPEPPAPPALSSHVPPGEARLVVEALERECRGWTKWRKYVKGVQVTPEQYAADHFIREEYGWLRGYYIEIKLKDDPSLEYASGHTQHYRAGHTGIVIATGKAFAGEQCPPDAACDGCLVEADLEFLSTDPP
jgi:hypothetical protein